MKNKNNPLNKIEIKKKEELKPVENVHSRKFELRRQLFHVFLGIILVVLIDMEILNAFNLIVIIVLGFLISLFSIKNKIPGIEWFLRRFERKKQMKKFPGKGVLFYLIGALIVVVIFPKDIALASIMVLAFGDAVSHLWGVHFGRIKNPFADKKFIEGSITGFLAGLMGAILYVRPAEAIVASLAAMIAEAIEVTIGTEQIDDNLIVPLISGIAIWLFRIFS